MTPKSISKRVLAIVPHNVRLQKILGRQKPNSLLVGNPRHGVAEVF